LYETAVSIAQNDNLVHREQVGSDATSAAVSSSSFISGVSQELDLFLRTVDVLKPSNGRVLRRILRLLSQIDAEKSKMTSYALAIVFSPTFFRYVLCMRQLPLFLLDVH